MQFINSFRFRIRDFIITKEDWIFSVVSYEIFDEEDKGEVKCLLRYIPDEKGGRFSERGCFRKLSFSEAYDFLKVHRPEYVKDVHIVRKEDIKEVFQPTEWLPVIAKREEEVRIIYDILKRRIPEESIGITGSFLCGLNRSWSDVDFVIYGLRNFKKAREVIEDTEEGSIPRINDKIWKHIYDKRKPELSYEDFVVHEERKKNKGMTGKGNSYFDILYVRDWNEVKKLDKGNYERGERIGYGKIIGEVKDATFSFDSPAIYQISHSKVNKVLSFSHTYAGQALDGEKIEARGVIERTKHETRLVIGTTREAKGEWIRSLSLSP